MLLIWILTGILHACGFPAAVLLWHWFGAHVLATVLLILFFA